MPVTKKVGSSAGRTPFKHSLYNKLLGQIVGVANVVKWITKLVIIDGCGGSGNANTYSETSSPEISIHHFLCALKLGLSCEVFLIERDAFTVTELLQNVDRWLEEYVCNELDLWQDQGAELERLRSLVHVIHGDYKSPETANQIRSAIRLGTAVFLYVDPNHAHDVELSEALQKVLPDTTTMLITWGCNAGGLKMLPLGGGRSKWFERLKYLLGLKRPNHDACLAALRRDDSQWAYLLTVPHQWRPKVEKNVESLGELYWAKGVECYWLNAQTFDFWELAERLFLTKEERNGKV